MNKGVKYWMKIIQDDLDMFSNYESVVSLMESFGDALEYFSIDDTGVMAYIIAPDFKGGLCIAEMMFYIRVENRGNIRLVKKYVAQLEQIAIDNKISCVKIGGTSGYKDAAFIKLLKRWGYIDDTVSKTL